MAKTKQNASTAASDANDAIRAQLPQPGALPTKQQLFRQALIAGAGAAVILVVAVLPAEYAVDLTGAGRLLGLQQMGEMKRELEKAGSPEEAKPEPAPPSAPSALASSTPASSAASTAPPSSSNSAAPTTRKDVTKVTLAPKKTTEVKAQMIRGAKLTFNWSADGGDVNFDLHSDKPGGAYHGYKKGKGVRADEGELVAAFDGWHGWYWRNVSDAEVTITLETSGDYAEVKALK